MKFIDLKRQYLAYKDEIDRAIQGVVESSSFILGKEVEALEEELSSMVGQRGAVGVASGTDALLLSLMALGVGPGDVILTTPFTFIATAEVVSLLGGEPHFSDIQPDTFNMDPDKLEETIKKVESTHKGPKGIIVVSLFGQVPDMDEILEIANRHGLFVIEDACQSFGAMYRQRPSCGLSTVAVTSFFPSKPLGCYGDGGMVFSSDPDLLAEIRALRDHGQKRRYIHERIGLNSRLDAIQAAVLRVKARHLKDEIKRRETIATRYGQLIEEEGVDVLPPVVRPDRNSVFAQYTIRIGQGMRDRVREQLASEGIPTAIHYPIPLHLQPCFKGLGYGNGAFPVAEEAAKEVLSLPMHPFLEEGEQVRVVKGIKEALRASA